MKKIKILVFPSDYIGGVGEFRSIKPHLFLENKYPELFSIDIAPPTFNFKDLSNFDGYDIVHYHKLLGTFETTEENIAYLNEKGIVSIMDVDDYWLPDMRHPSYRHIINNKIDKLILNNLKIANTVTTTTDIFKNEIQKINKNVHVIENGIDPRDDQFTPNPTKSERVRFGWLGGSTHKHDLDVLRENINKMMSSPLKDKVQLVLCGFDLRGTVKDIHPVTKEIITRPYHPTETTWYEYEKIFTNNYTTISKEYRTHLLKFTNEEFPGVENEPYRRVWTKPIKSYANNYNLFDVALAPLVDSKLNMCKSQLKVIESGFHNKPIIAQNFGPYTIDLKNSFTKGGDYSLDANGLLVDKVKNKGDWFKFMKKLVEDEELRTTLGNNLHDTVLNKYSLDILSEKRKDLYLSLLNKK